MDTAMKFISVFFFKKGSCNLEREEQK